MLKDTSGLVRNAKDWPCDRRISLPAQTSASGFKPSNIAGSRHSEGHRTLVRTMENPNPPGERRQNLQERLRQLAQINFSGGPADTPPADAPSPIKSQNLELVHPELPEVPLEPADILHISPSLLVPSVEMEHQDHLSMESNGHLIMWRAIKKKIITELVLCQKEHPSISR